MTRRVGSRYVAHDVLGRGASGTVWRGEGPEGPVAIKILRPELVDDPEVVARFVRERTVLVRLDHPSLVRIHDLVAEGDTVALILDLVPGPSLRDRLIGSGPLSPADTAEVVSAVAAALASAHTAGVVHRDIKPENVLLAHGDRPLLTDFGIALLAEGDRLTHQGTYLGTPDYLAPEIASGQSPTPAADVYACGVLLYELLTGATPFAAAHPVAVLHRHLHERPARPDGVPDPLWQMMLRCLAKDPAERPDAMALSLALRVMAPALRGHRALVAEGPPSSTPAPPTHLSGAPPGAPGSPHPPWPRVPPPTPAVPPTVAARPVVPPPPATPAAQARPTHLGRDAVARPVGDSPARGAIIGPDRSRRRLVRILVIVAVVVAVLAAGAVAVRLVQKDDGEQAFTAPTGWLCTPWQQSGRLEFRPCVMGAEDKIVARAELRGGAGDVRLKLLRTDEPRILASRACTGTSGRANVCGPIEQPLAAGARYTAVATLPDGTAPVRTPLVEAP